MQLIEAVARVLDRPVEDILALDVEPNRTTLNGRLAALVHDSDALVAEFVARDAEIDELMARRLELAAGAFRRTLVLRRERASRAAAEQLLEHQAESTRRRRLSGAA